MWAQWCLKWGWVWWRSLTHRTRPPSLPMVHAKEIRGSSHLKRAVRMCGGCACGGWILTWERVDYVLDREIMSETVLPVHRFLKRCVVNIWHGALSSLCLTKYKFCKRLIHYWVPFRDTWKLLEQGFPSGHSNMKKHIRGCGCQELQKNKQIMSQTTTTAVKCVIPATLSPEIPIALYSCWCQLKIHIPEDVNFFRAPSKIARPRPWLDYLHHSKKEFANFELFGV